MNSAPTDAQLIGLTPADLFANRAAKLSEAQRAVLGKHRVNNALIGLLLAVISAHAAWLALATQDLSPVKTGAFLLLSLIAVIFSLSRIRRAIALHRDLKQNTCAQTTRPGNIVSAPHSGIQRYLPQPINIDSLRTVLPAHVCTQFQADSTYRLYYTPKAGHFLGAESTTAP